MFKKIIIATAVLAATSSMAMGTNAPYLGVSVGVVDHTTKTDSFRGMPFSIMGGYGAVVNQNLYLGGELFATLFTSALDTNTTNKSLRTTWGYGVSFIPGFMITDHTLGFVRLGLIRSRFDSLKASSTGGQFGLGLQTNVAQNWDLRGEYDYVGYGNVKGVSPKSDQFNMSLLYKFA